MEESYIRRNKGESQIRIKEQIKGQIAYQDQRVDYGQSQQTQNTQSNLDQAMQGIIDEFHTVHQARAQARTNSQRLQGQDEQCLLCKSEFERRDAVCRLNCGHMFTLIVIGSMSGLGGNHSTDLHAQIAWDAD